MSDKKRWGRIYSSHSHDHPRIQMLTEPITKWVAEHSGIKKNSSVLEIGCGSGRYTYQLLKHTDHVLGIDNNPELLKINPYKTILGNAYKLPFPDNTLDVCFCSCLLHHLEKPRLALDEMLRVAKESVVVVEPNRNSWVVLLNALKNREWEMLKFNLGRALEGFNVVERKQMEFISYKKAPGFLIPMLKRLKCFDIAIISKEGK